MQLERKNLEYEEIWKVETPKLCEINQLNI